MNMSLIFRKTDWGGYLVDPFEEEEVRKEATRRARKALRRIKRGLKRRGADG
jgi:non-canonical (house-cleaning) NTP pyrophosphatase